jgi:ribosomal protein S27AE
MIGLTDEGRYVVRDSNLLNYKRIANHLKDSHSRGSISEAGQYYWIYEKKVTSIPSCSRCGTGAEGAPEVMFLSEYTCGKCLTATQRRSDFLCGTAG